MISAGVRKAVMERDRGLCQLLHRTPVPATEIAHVTHQGMGGDPASAEVNQPANLISVCSSCHAKLHGPGIPYQIVRWGEEGLEVVDREGRMVPHEDLWYYAGKEWEANKDRLEWLRQSVSALRALRWEIAKTLAIVKATGGHTVAGYDDLYQFCQELGLSSRDVKRLIRAAKFAEQCADVMKVDPDVADAIRRVPEEERQEIVTLFADYPVAEAWKTYHDRYGKERMRTYRKFRVVGGKIAFEEIKARFEDDVGILPGEVVMRGGSVIAGAEQEGE